MTHAYAGAVSRLWHERAGCRSFSALVAKPSWKNPNLLAHRNVSPRRSAATATRSVSCSSFSAAKLHVEPVALNVTDLGPDVILAFLESLERERNNSARSRNARLAAICSFFRWIAVARPDLAGLATPVRAIPTKRTDRRLICSLSRPEIQAILATPDLSSPSGRGDHALLLTMYNTAARVSEITSMESRQIEFGSRSSFVHLHGEGRKERSVPLWTRTADALRKWTREQDKEPGALLFTNYRGEKLTRNDVDAILQKAVSRATDACPALSGKHVSP
ncbi:tyrosine-type recombinase/integrase [Trinickia caryophylli]|uniref:Phage integrase, N-terminal SAM-like domain n=1 Tax=Trinickia caryophylli TaxID=28094 RepID=A0A1X7D047_TRICW|nr:tyrosine-type recombinase/integrase [Trinickia caryophylli]WQE15203.1 tyrosine-type recombinase/integrase [Trinickia caryophylli]SMF05907.1 Phage integrase, N-terminal SAM-like domain [Trinickia caryophylli]